TVGQVTNLTYGAIADFVCLFYCATTWLLWPRGVRRTCPSDEPGWADSHAPAIPITTDTGSSTHGDQSSCFTTITHTRFTSASGMNTFHARLISWSKRKRGSVQRTSM